MSVKKMAELIGRYASVKFETLAVTCRIQDVKVSYGQPRLLVAPFAGVGEQWVDTTRVIAFLEVPAREHSDLIHGLPYVDADGKVQFAMNKRGGTR